MPFTFPPELVEMFAAFLLVFFRMTGLVISAPLLSGQTLPMAVRVWFAFWVALVSFPMVRHLFDDESFTLLFRTPALSAVMIASELAMGWIIGFIASLVIYISHICGHFVGQEVGLAIGEIFDPVSQTSSTPIANLFMTVSILVFVLMNGHMWMFEAWVQSFKVFPPASIQSVDPSVFFDLAKNLGSLIWRYATVMALPIMGALMLATVAMAILARVVPEMNIFMLGFSIRIGIGLIAVCGMSVFFVEYMTNMVDESEQCLGEFLTLVGQSMGRR